MPLPAQLAVLDGNAAVASVAFRLNEVIGIEPGDPMYLPPEQRIVIW